MELFTPARGEVLDPIWLGIDRSNSGKQVEDQGANNLSFPSPDMDRLYPSGAVTILPIITKLDMSSLI